MWATFTTMPVLGQNRISLECRKGANKNRTTHAGGVITVWLSRQDGYSSQRLGNI